MDYGRIYGSSKKATEDVLGWLRSLSSASPHISLTAHLDLAEQATRDGANMPKNIIDNLRTAIATRQQLAEYHATTGGLDERHIYIIDVLWALIQSFCPKQAPSVLQSSIPEACDYQATPLYEPAQLFQQPYEHQEYACPEYEPTTSGYSAFYPQPLPRFAPCYPIPYFHETGFECFVLPTSPSDISEAYFQHSAINRRPSPEERPSPPQDTLMSKSFQARY